MKAYQVIIIISDITQAKIDEEEIRKLHEFKNRVLDTAPISIAVLDARAKVISLNSLAESLMGSDIMGKKIINTKEIKNSKRLLELFNGLFYSGKPFYFNN
jgi:PAS domain-containing protein